MIEIAFSVSTTWYSVDNATFKHTPVLIICVGTYYRSIRTLQLSCQFFRLDSTPGGQSEWTGLSRNEVTCGASRCQHSHFLRTSVERWKPVRSVRAWQHCLLSLRTTDGNAAMTFHEVLQRKYCVSDLQHEIWFCWKLHYVIYTYMIHTHTHTHTHTHIYSTVVHYSLKISFPQIL